MSTWCHPRLLFFLLLFFWGGFVFVLFFFVGSILLIFFVNTVVLNCFVCLHPVSNVACMCLWIVPLVSLTFIRLYSSSVLTFSMKTQMKFVMNALWNWTVGLPYFYLDTNVFHYCIIYIVIKMYFPDVAPLQSTNVKPRLMQRTNHSARVQHQESSVLYLHTYIYKFIIIIEK